MAVDEAPGSTADAGREASGEAEANHGSSSSEGTSPEEGFKIFRATEQEEILAIRDIAHEGHAEGRYAHIPFSERKFIRFFSKAISSPEDSLALYVQYQGETVGMLNAGVGDYYLGEGGRMATVYILYVSKKVRHTLLGGKIGVTLMRMAGDWAKAQKAEELHIHSTSGIDVERTDKLLRRLGFLTYGGNYSVGLS